MDVMSHHPVHSRHEECVVGMGISSGISSTVQGSGRTGALSWLKIGPLWIRNDKNTRHGASQKRLEKNKVHKRPVKVALSLKACNMHQNSSIRQEFV